MRRLGPVDCLDVIQDPDAPWVVLFHGYGADAGDLQGLVDLIPLNKPYNFLFPQGLMEVPIGPGWTGRAWWTIDMERIQRDMMAGVERDTSQEIPATLPDVRAKCFKMLEALKVPWNRITLGGFSQGGMIATDLALRAPEAPAGLVILSSALINKNEWATHAPSRAGLPFFQAHGEGDQVLRFKNGQRLETLLTQAGLKGRLLKFPGGHEIPPRVIQELGRWLDANRPVQGKP